MADIPHFDASFAPGVDVLGGVGHGDSAHHVTVGQRVDLPDSSWNSRSYEGVWWERNWPSLSISIDMERVCTENVFFLNMNNFNFNS